MQLHTIHTVPVWCDDGRPHVAGIGEIRPDLENSVIGWANLAEITVADEKRVFLLVIYDDE